MNQSVLTKRSVFLLLGVVFIAANLRAPFTGLPPVLTQIQAGVGLTATGVGILTALPLLIFALVSPLSASLAQRMGLERSLFGAVFIIALGISLRSVGGQLALFSGTVLIGAGIALGNVLLPSLIKRNFSHHITAVTGAYVLSMGVAAALASTLVSPIAERLGWQLALFSFIFLPIVALILWWRPMMTAVSTSSALATEVKKVSLWRSALAWQVTLYLGLNSTIYYVVISWLPVLLKSSGYSAVEAGSIHGVLQLATAVPGLVLASLLRRLPDQCRIAFIVCVLSAVALLGFLYVPQWAWLWAVLFGFGTGSGIILGLAFIGLRSNSVSQSTALSGMSQCIGYLLASAGPVVIGTLYTWSGAWTLPLWLAACLAVLGATMGGLAGRSRTLHD